MNITLGSDDSVAISRGEKITRGQSRSKLIKVNWRSNESPPELPISDTKHIGIESLVVQVNITRPDGEYSGWQDMIKIDGEISYYYPLQKWDTEVPGKAWCQIRWFEAGEDGDDDDTTVQTSNQVSFVIDNGVIAQTLLPTLADYTTWQAIIAGLQANAFKKYDAKNLPNDAVFNVDGKKSAPAIYFNVENGDYSGLLIVSKHESGNNTIQTEILFAIGGIFERTITFLTNDYNDATNDNPTGTATAYRDLTKNNFTEAQLAALNSGITASKMANLLDLIPAQASADNQLLDKNSADNSYVARKGSDTQLSDTTQLYAWRSYIFNGTRYYYDLSIRVSPINDINGLDIPRYNGGGRLLSYNPVNELDVVNLRFMQNYVFTQIASAITSVYRYKGSVASYANLPSTDLTAGDVYNVIDTGDNYAWTGSAWDKLAGDLNIQNGNGRDSIVQKYTGEVNVNHFGNTNTGEASAEFGEANINGGHRSVVGGKLNRSESKQSFIGGLGNGRGNTPTYNAPNPKDEPISGDNLLMVGTYNSNKSTDQTGTLGKGWDNIIGGNRNHNVDGRSIMMVGHNNENENDDIIIGGHFNENISGDLLELGNGSDGSRHNAFRVTEMGVAKAYGIPSENEDCVRVFELKTKVNVSDIDTTFFNLLY